MLVAIIRLSILLSAEVAFLICFQIRKGSSPKDARQSLFPGRCSCVYSGGTS